MMDSLMDRSIEVILALGFYLGKIHKTIIMLHRWILVLMAIKCLPDSQIFNFKIHFKKIIKYQVKEEGLFKA